MTVARAGPRPACRPSPCSASSLASAPRSAMAYASASSLPGSTPSSSASSRRVRWNQSRASVRRPARCNARISAADRDSRRGCTPASARSTAAALACSPIRDQAPASDSTEARRSSSRAWAAACSGWLG
ncbi:hypothetical protein SALBM135S_09326 [Streptomyces alboniger]